MMKLRNKKTGEIREIKEIIIDGMFNVKSLAELKEEWQDYEEPKEYYYLNEYLELDHEMWTDTEFDNKLKTLGNYFENKEDAEKAVEKLKAIKRLKETGFRFIGKTCEYKPDKHFGSVFFETSENILNIYEDIVEFYDDLDLLFGDEE